MEITAEKNNSVIKKIGNIVFWVILGLVAIYAVVAFSSKKQDQVTSVFGKTGLIVLTDSMLPEFAPNDLIWVDVVNYATFDFSTLAVGDVITFSDDVMIDGETVTILNSHRIENIIVDINGYYHFYTKGDNAPADAEPTSESGVVGVWTGNVWRNAGGFFDFLLGSWGFFIFIVLPCFGFLVYEIFRFVKIVSVYNVQKALGNRDTMQAEAVAIARAQIEAELKAKYEAEKKSE